MKYNESVAPELTTYFNISTDTLDLVVAIPKPMEAESYAPGHICLSVSIDIYANLQMSHDQVVHVDDLVIIDIVDDGSMPSAIWEVMNNIVKTITTIVTDWGYLMLMSEDATTIHIGDSNIYYKSELNRDKSNLLILRSIMGSSMIKFRGISKYRKSPWIIETSRYVSANLNNDIIEFNIDIGKMFSNMINRYKRSAEAPFILPKEYHDAIWNTLKCRSIKSQNGYRALYSDSSMNHHNQSMLQSHTTPIILATLSKSELAELDEYVLTKMRNELSRIL